ncbi:unnamed protein product [Chrysoparadoxa australica]
MALTRDNSTVQEKREHRRMSMLIEGAANRSPPWLANILMALKPFLGIALALLNTFGPIVLSFYWKLYQLYLALPHNLISLLYGLILCFLGGHFFVFIAATEAFSALGGEKIGQAFTELIEDFQALKKAHDKDNKEDLDNDGIADVDQISADALVSRKMALALRTIKPDRLTRAISGFYQGMFGVVTVLRFQFARTVTLAISIGDYMRPIAGKFLGPALAYVIPEGYQQWIMPAINYVCKAIAMAIAWYIQRIISTVQSAIKGGLLVFRSILMFLDERNLLHVKHDETYIDEVLGWALAGCGAYFQIMHNWSLPWYVDLALWPFHFAEWWLKWMVTYMDVPTEDIVS